MLDSEFACAFPTAQHPETAVFITREGSAVPADQFFVAHFTFFDVSRLRPGGLAPAFFFRASPNRGSVVGARAAATLEPRTAPPRRRFAGAPPAESERRGAAFWAAYRGCKCNSFRTHVTYFKYPLSTIWRTFANFR